jgi:hypothetical protein
MDIRKFKVNQTTRLVLKDAKGEPITDDGKEVAVIVHGPASKRFALARQNQNNRMMDKLKTKGNAEQTPEQTARETAEFLTECTESFEHVERDDLQGADLAKAIYMDASIGFIAEQVNKHIGDWANFLPVSTKS